MGAESARETGRPLRDVVVIGGSAGALEPLKRIVAGLPVGLPAVVLVVLHMSRTSASSLAKILTRVGGLPANACSDGEPLRRGHIVVAIPDHHLIIVDDSLQNSSDPAVNSSRPAIDVLFDSAARVYGSRVMGVILSGGLDDGSAGLETIGLAGGITIVQNPRNAKVSAMPTNAIERALPDHVVNADEIAPLLARFVARPNGQLTGNVPSSRRGGS